MDCDISMAKFTLVSVKLSLVSAPILAQLLLSQPWGRAFLRLYGADKSADYLLTRRAGVLLACR
jgi:hypothetical protein